jgi:hypothetical protein
VCLDNYRTVKATGQTENIRQLYLHANHPRQRHTAARIGHVCAGHGGVAGQKKRVIR